jgi:hypothetical protein
MMTKKKKKKKTDLAQTAILLAHFDWRRDIRVRGQGNFFRFAIGANSRMLVQHTCRYRKKDQKSLFIHPDWSKKQWRVVTWRRSVCYATRATDYSALWD